MGAFAPPSASANIRYNPANFMAIAIGQRLGSYEVTALLGKGGMGQVYRARDTKLKRDVAIKILPDEFCSDADRVSRFQREAEVLASLNHQHIAAIYDLEDFGQSRFLMDRGCGRYPFTMVRSHVFRLQDWQTNPPGVQRAS